MNKHNYEQNFTKEEKYTVEEWENIRLKIDDNEIAANDPKVLKKLKLAVNDTIKEINEHTTQP